MSKIFIRKGTIDEAVSISRGIPEFENVYGEEEYMKRMKNRIGHILIAESGGKAAGFKAGYVEDGYFYSWMGGVVPEFRRMEIARKLAKEQEEWVIAQGINTIRFKTQNKFKGMLIFALKNGFRIIGTEKFAGGEGFKIVLEKELIDD